MEDLFQRASATMQERRLVLPGDSVLLALSGGPDSTALAHLFTRLRGEWELSLSAVHVNHGLRGAESDGDERFVRDFCEHHEITLAVRRGDLDAGTPSLQAAARDIRRARMLEERERSGADVIATAHTMTDRVETVLLNLTRGAGLRGLSGIVYRGGRFVRPLLDATREDVFAYLSSHGIAFREDSSNTKTGYGRNKLRLSIVPELERGLGRSITAPIARSARIAAEARDFIAHVADQWLTEAVQRDEKRHREIVDAGALRMLPPAVGKEAISIIAKRWAGAAYHPDLSFVESVWESLASPESKAFGWLGVDFTLEAGVLTTGSPGSAPRLAPLDLPVPGRLRLESGAAISASRRLMARDESAGFPSSLDEAWLDADLVREPLRVRGWRDGDRLRPLGAPGTRKLQDLFVDRKVPRTFRGRVPLLEDADGIVWVAGVEIADRVRITDRTRTIIEVAIHWGG